MDRHYKTEIINKTAVILAGGKGSRMNYKNKGLLTIRGGTFIQNILGALYDYAEIIIVSNTPKAYEYLGYKVVRDIIPECGPMGGIHAGLTYATYEQVLIVACDMPNLSREIASYMGRINEVHDAIIPIVEDKRQPLLGIYHKRSMENLSQQLQEGKLKLVTFLDHIDTYYVNIDHKASYKCFHNINTVEDYHHITKGD